MDQITCVVSLKIATQNESEEGKTKYSNSEAFW